MGLGWSPALPPATVLFFLTLSILSCISSGWSFLAPSSMWRHKCSPAVPLTRCSPAQPRSGQWRRSSLPRTVWQRVKRLARCWHIDASRRASPGWCTERYPGHTAQTLWVHAAPAAVRALISKSSPASRSSIQLGSFTGSVIPDSDESRRNHPQWTPKEIHWDVNFKCRPSHLMFC